MFNECTLGAIKPEKSQTVCPTNKKPTEENEIAANNVKRIIKLIDC